MSTALTSIYNKLKNYPQYMECMLSISYLPEECVDTSKLNIVTAGGVQLKTINDFDTPIIRPVLSVDKYAGYNMPVESKLLMYPYSYVEMTAYNGESIDLKLEHFAGSLIDVESWGFMSPDTRLAYVLKDYNFDTSLDNALIINDLPQLATASSSYQQYLASTKASKALAYGMGGLAIAGGAGLMMTGAGAGVGLASIAGGATAIAGQIAQQKDAQYQPNSVNTQKGGSGFNIANGLKGFTLKKKQIKPEYKIILEQYWGAFGYKVNQIKLPNLNTRIKFNHVKTVGVNITGDVPAEHMTKIKNMFNNGVTFWHDPNTFGNTTQSNGVR